MTIAGVTPLGFLAWVGAGCLALMLAAVTYSLVVTVVTNARARLRHEKQMRQFGVMDAALGRLVGEEKKDG